uniref:Uncharacterized protein n=1 Tax=Gasterosteus aculeatus TaxID=69293 RepID=G3PF50_GASAC
MQLRVQKGRTGGLSLRSRKKCVKRNRTFFLYFFFLFLWFYEVVL